jgi:hypothetical protein
MLAGRIGATLDAALVRQAALALEEQLLPLAAAPLALRPGVACHQMLASSSACVIQECGGGEVSI